MGYGIGYHWHILKKVNYAETNGLNKDEIEDDDDP